MISRCLPTNHQRLPCSAPWGPRRAMVCLEIICLAIPNSEPFYRPDQGPGGHCRPQVFNEGCLGHRPWIKHWLLVTEHLGIWKLLTGQKASGHCYWHMWGIAHTQQRCYLGTEVPEFLWLSVPGLLAWKPHSLPDSPGTSPQNHSLIMVTRAPGQHYALNSRGNHPEKQSQEQEAQSKTETRHQMGKHQK